MRLPLIALIDVVLFLLFYFMIAGSLAPEESSLASTLGTDAKRKSAAGDLQPQILNVVVRESKIVFQIGDRAFDTEAGLRAMLAQLPREAGVVIKVANEVPVASAAIALQSCKDVGFSKVTYVAGK